MDSEPMIPERDPDNLLLTKIPKPKPRIQKFLEKTTRKNLTKLEVGDEVETIEMKEPVRSVQPRATEFDNEGFSDNSSGEDSELNKPNTSEKIMEESQRLQKERDDDDRSSATFSISSESEDSGSEAKNHKTKLRELNMKDEDLVQYKDKAMDLSKDEYVSITMSSETEHEISYQGRVGQRKGSLIDKWKKGFKTFIKSTSTMSSSQEDNIHREDTNTSTNLTVPIKDDKDQIIEEKQPTASYKQKHAGIRRRGQKTYSTNAMVSTSQSDKKFNELLGIVIHNSDLLQMDPHILHPLVKVTLMTEDGLYISKTKPKAANIYSPRERQLSPKKIPHNAGIDSPRDKTIYPLMTQPLSFNKNMYSVPMFSPKWEELLLFDEPFSTFVNPELKVIAFFEIMDFLPMNCEELNKWNTSYHGMDAGWYKIAWGFLKLVGSDGSLNCNHKVRLQLYKPEKLSPKEMEAGPSEVYCWWKLNKRAKYKSTLYVTIKGVNPSDKTSGSIRTLLAMGKDELAEAIIQSQLQHKVRKSKQHKRNHRQNTQLTEKESRTNIRQIPKWNRISGQSCKIPSKLLMSLPASSISSINLNVHGNVYCVKFSPCGLKLVAGLDTEELHAILVFEFPSGTLLKSFRGHYGLIYDLDWYGISTNPGEYPDIYLIGSASGDSTARIWKLDESAGDCQSGLIKTLPHPSFVYSIKFHPGQPNLVATGCFDYAIRFWDISRNGDSARPYITLDRHYSFVNSIAFSLNGEYLFSGDGNGNVYKWKSGSTNPKKWKVEKNAKYAGVINNLVVHPNGKRILAHIRSNQLKVIDIETFLVLTTFNGLSNETFQIQSCFSPCGNLVLSGSEDTTIYIWDANTGKILEFISPESHPHAIISCVSFHPYDNYLAIGLSSSISEPTPILVYGVPIVHPSPKLGVPTLAQMKLDFQKKQRKYEQKHDQENLEKTSQFLQTRGDSKEKFRTIIKKLDEVTRAGQEKPKSMADIAQEALEKHRKLPIDVAEYVEKAPVPVPKARRQIQVTSSSESNEHLE